MVKITFVRHGQSKANAENFVGLEDTPLTLHGIDQAHDTALKIKDLGITHIVSSPLLRACQTAQVIAEELRITPDKITTLDELRERDFGVLKGKPKTYGSMEYFVLDDINGVETMQELLDRMIVCVQKLRVLGADNGLLVIGHAISGYCLTEAAKGKTKVSELDPPFQIENAEFLTISI